MKTGRASTGHVLRIYLRSVVNRSQLPTLWDIVSCNGQKCQLRTDMLSTYHRNKDARKLRQYEAENFVLMYQAYKAMGGNSFIDEIYEHVTKWDVET